MKLPAEVDEDRCRAKPLGKHETSADVSGGVGLTAAETEATVLGGAEWEVTEACTEPEID